MRLALAVSAPSPRVLVSLDALTVSHRTALLEPLELIAARAGAAVVTSAELVTGLPPAVRSSVRLFQESALSEHPLESVEAVLSVGDHLFCGSLGHEFARARGIPYWVVQHGLVNPFSPPLPLGSRLLAWSTEDGDFISTTSGDGLDITVVGSQLLWNAAHAAGAPACDLGAAPLFLGQLHGAELDRSVVVRTVGDLLAEGPLVYRPHPAERDLLSRLQHRRWARRGLAFDEEGLPLPLVQRPVLGIFSTGLLEAAAGGRASWAACSDPPAWVERLWDRYGIARRGSSEPTQPPEPPPREPAQAIADLLFR